LTNYRLEVWQYASQPMLLKHFHQSEHYLMLKYCA